MVCRLAVFAALGVLLAGSGCSAGSQSDRRLPASQQAQRLLESAIGPDDERDGRRDPRRPASR